MPSMAMRKNRPAALQNWGEIDDSPSFAWCCGRRRLYPARSLTGVQILGSQQRELPPVRPAGSPGAASVTPVNLP